MKITSFRRVGLFVDWNSILLEAPDEFEDRHDLRNGYALQTVGKTVTRFLCELNKNEVFRVRIRLYHGWTTGVTLTANRRAVAALPGFDEPDDIFPSERVLAMSDVEFGDRLLDALSTRENKGLRIHLPNTCRRQGGDKVYTEKMVDTALASDLLSWARGEPNSVAVVMSPDDDVVPPVFVAEAWMKPHGGEVYLLRGKQRGESRFLMMDGILA
jgi:hypothetical protein